MTMFTYSTTNGATAIEGDYFQQYAEAGVEEWRQDWSLILARAGFELVQGIGTEGGAMEIDLYFWRSRDPQSRERPEFTAFIEVTYNADRVEDYLLPTTHDALDFLKHYVPLIESFAAIEHYMDQSVDRDKRRLAEWEASRHGR